MKTETQTRRFYNKEGFGDGTAYIEVGPNGSFAVDPWGNKMELSSLSFSAMACEERVADGMWFEYPAPMNAQEITEAQVVQWLQAQREKHGLDCIQIIAHAPVEARNGHHGLPAYSSVAAHIPGLCKLGDTITEAVNKLT